MNKPPQKIDRRRLLNYALWGAAAAQSLRAGIGRAEGLSKIDSSDATAKGLDYHADATSVDRGDYPEYEPTQSCASCLQRIDSGEQHGCKLMPGREIDLGGWCKVWTAKS
jgi:hypothetical protein